MTRSFTIGPFTIGPFTIGRTRPRVRTQIELQRLWRHIVRGSPYDRRGLRCFFIGEQGFATRNVVTFGDIQGPLSTLERDYFTAWVQDILEGAGTGWRVALLIVRPGPAALGHEDLTWAATLYEAARQAGVGGEVVHLAADGLVVPVPLDALPDPAVGL